MIRTCLTLVAATVVGATLFLGLAGTGGGVASANAQSAGAAKGSPTWAPGGKRERWTPDNCAFAFRHSAPLGPDGADCACMAF